MDALFLKLLNMSITAGWLVLAVLLVRPLLKKAPKTLQCGLWAVVAVRLLLPFSIESIVSLIPAAEPIPPDILYSPTPTIQSGVPLIDSAINPILSESLSPNLGDSVNPMQILTAIAANVWLLGVIAMLIYVIVSYIRVYRKVRVRLPLQPRVYECDTIPTPFIFGLFRPCIYLPSSLSSTDRTYVIAHEQAHLKRLDHIWKPLGFLLLTVYWFNPLLWVAYIVLCRDIELACDERVIRNMDKEDTAAYTEALLHCSAKQKFITACPLAFGESGVKARIKNALHYKKPAFWLILTAIAVCIAVAVCFLTNPLSPKNYDDASSGSELEGVSISVQSLDLFGEPPSITIRWQNDTAKELLYGESFRLYRIENDCLVDTNLIINSAFNSIGYLLSPFQHIEKTYNLNGYNLSKDGVYRFKSTINHHQGDATSYKLWVDFELNGNQVISPLLPIPDDYTIEDKVLTMGDENVSVVYPRLRGTTKDYEILNTFVVNNLTSKLYELREQHPRNSAVEMDYTITYQDETIVSLLFEGMLTPPDGAPVEIAFTEILAPGNDFTVNPESLITIDEAFCETFRTKWLALWDDANLTYQKHQEIKNTISDYSADELATLLRDPATAELGFSENGVLVIFRGQPLIGDYILFEIPYPNTVVSFDEYAYNDSPDFGPPTLKLSDETATFEFCFSALSSYLPTGTYALENNVLTLNTSDGKYYYTFLKTDNGFVFDAAVSSPIPSYRYSEGSEAICPVPDGAVFQPMTAEPQPTFELHMPDAIYDTYSSYDGEMTDVYTRHDAHTVRVVTVGNDSEPQLVKLNDAQIYHLNKLYAAVTDFSEQDGPSPTDNVIRIKHDGKSDSFYYAHAKQAELNLYIHALMDACDMSPIGLHELYQTGDTSSLTFTSVYCQDEQATTDIAFKDGVLYCQSLQTENGEQCEHLDRLTNGAWERLSSDSFETLGLQNTVTYPLYERIGSWILFSNAENAIFLMDTTQNTVYDMDMTLAGWRKIATDNESRLAFLSAVPIEQGDEIYMYQGDTVAHEIYTYEIRLYDLT